MNDDNNRAGETSERGNQINQFEIHLVTGLCEKRPSLIQSYEPTVAKLLRLIPITGITGPFPPLRATDRDFAQKLRKLDLQIETIANGHGWIGTMVELRNARWKPIVSFGPPWKDQ